MSTTGRRIRLAFVGDISLGFMKRQVPPPKVIPDWGAIEAAIGEPDLLVGNLECCLVDERCTAQESSQPMATPVSAAPLLANAGFSVLCLANNHMLDCGPESLAVTRANLDKAGISAFGAGANVDEAEAPAYRSVRGTRIAFLGACDSERYYASADRAGVAPLQETRLIQRIRDAAAEADLIVVTLHADLEFTTMPAPWRQRLARRLVSEGADLVIQHHPHVLQGAEKWRDGLIAYSLGNFIFSIQGNSYQESHAGVSDSAVLIVDIDVAANTRTLSRHVVPVSITSTGFPRLVTAGLDEASDAFESLSCALAHDRQVRAIWFARCRAEASLHFWAFYYGLRRLRFKQALGDLARLFVRRQNRRWLLGLLSGGYI
ncbi:poly-gamma-glutamate capsule biosynthesis protein [Salinisphaera dokdonensis CL-ES53]|uniref:Poly-gamma-glutamate capsule biosynthesis protein n=1 Tax=Salinisphaera dokdonensis CL-ES53 TaxID=1304272 RepID=A0ABV2B485_9GAMM